jgi:serine/threonine protein phosphatase PrpC
VVSALLHEQTLYVGHLGDCRAIVGTVSGSAIQITVDHRVTNDEEYERVIRDGGCEFVVRNNVCVFVLPFCFPVNRD